jgi:hypothetical protein
MASDYGKHRQETSSKEPRTNNKRNQKKTRDQNGNPEDKQGIGEKRERGLVE